MDLYEQGPAAIYFATLPQQAEKVCKPFTRAILQTRSSLQLLLTVELYGREPADDVPRVQRGSCNRASTKAASAPDFW